MRKLMVLLSAGVVAALATGCGSDPADYINPPGTVAHQVEKHARSRLVGQISEVSVSADGDATIAYRIRIGIDRERILREAGRFMYKVFDDPDCKDVQTITVRPQAELVDKYGKTFIEYIAMLELTRSVAKKVNWENIWHQAEMVEQLLQSEGVLWWHNVARK